MLAWKPAQAKPSGARQSSISQSDLKEQDGKYHGPAQSIPLLKAILIVALWENSKTDERSGAQKQRQRVVDSRCHSRRATIELAQEVRENVDKCLNTQEMVTDVLSENENRRTIKPNGTPTRGSASDPSTEVM